MLNRDILNDIIRHITPDNTVGYAEKPGNGNGKYVGYKIPVEFIQSGIFRKSNLYLSMNTLFVLKIEEIVCRLYGCLPRELYGFSTSAKSSDPRKLCFMLCRDEAGLSYQAIADRYGKRTKPGVFQAIKTARGLVEVDRRFKQIYFVAISQIYAGRIRKKTRLNQLSIVYDENEMS